MPGSDPLNAGPNIEVEVILPGMCLGGVCTRIAWFVINSLQTGIVPKITWKNEMRQRKQENCWQQPEDRRRSSLQWWRWSARPMSNLQTARGLWPEAKRWKLEEKKSAKSKSDIMWVVRKLWGAQCNASSVSLSLSERVRQPAKKLHSLVNVHNGR